MSICLEKNKWYIKYTYVTPDGLSKRVNIKRTLWDKSIMSKRDMEKIELDEILKDKQKRDKSYLELTSIKVKDLCNKYLEDCDTRLKNQTYYGNKLIVQKYVLSFFSNNLLDQSFTVTSMDIFRNKIIAQPICQARMNKVLSVMREIITYAYEHEYMSVQYANRCLVILKPIKVNEARQDKLQFWVPGEWDRFINTFSDDEFKWKVLFETAYAGAFRVGELICLQVKDFNYTNRTMYVCKSADNFGVIGSPKNQASVANVFLPQKVCDDILALIKSENLSDEQFIFFGSKMTTKASIRAIMTKHIDMAHVPYIKIHGLRHSCASLLINKGASPMMVSKHLRHASTNETLKTYAHLFPTDTQDMINNIL